ncbi:MAG: hypothetical protein JO235_10855 [Chroococcidiopsidaceae cyanobacterium CP_BM_RX_35]|nr:hypothetical protein [Chroococcidiopsidaceae cyanobacterium CP_BM_RX_35]
MKVIAYLLYGDKEVYQKELSFSILSALRLLKDNLSNVTISIISDRKNFNPNLPVDYIDLSQGELTEWTHNGNYNHRAKICALTKALDYYQAPVIMIDTDTYFIDDPSKLFERVSPQKSLMDCPENYTIGDKPFWRPLVEKIGHGIEVEGIDISPQSPMFNSGVIGVDITNRMLLEKSLVLNDELYSLSPIFNVEQFSIGTVLNKYTELLFSDDIVAHYHGIKRPFIHVQISRLLKDFKAASLETLIAASNTLELDLPRRSFKDKIITRILAFVKHWDGNYRFAYLAYRSALYYASKDTDYANAWASLTLLMAKIIVNESVDNQQNSAPHLMRDMENDFQEFRKGKIEALTWIDSSIRSNWIRFWDQLA